MTVDEGKSVAVLLNFIFLTKGYSMTSLERACTTLAGTGKVPGWDAERVRWEATPKWQR